MFQISVLCNKKRQNTPCQHAQLCFQSKGILVSFHWHNRSLECENVQHVSHISVRDPHFSSFFLLIYERLLALVIPLNAGECLDVIYIRPALLFGRVLGWKGSVATNTSNKRAPGPLEGRAPGPLEGRARPEKTDPRNSSKGWARLLAFWSLCHGIPEMSVGLPCCLCTQLRKVVILLTG